MSFRGSVAFTGCAVPLVVVAACNIEDVAAVAPITEAKPEGASGAGTDADSGWLTTGGVDPVGPCGDDPLCHLPPGEHVPTKKPDGLPSPLPGVYDDQGPAPPDNQFRALIGFPTRQRGALEQRVDAIYDPDSPQFRRYLGVDEWMADHAPSQFDFDLVYAWLRSRGFRINYVARNRLLLHFSGSVADFNESFATELHICMRKNPLWDDPPFPVYCTLDNFTLPKFVAERTNGLASADLPAEKGELGKEVGEVVADPPGPDAYGPAVFWGAYDLLPLHKAGFDGRGSRLGVIGAGTIHTVDLRIFWKSFGVQRGLPNRVPLMEPAFERVTETSLDVQWSSSMAPGADVLLYEGPDARNTALLFAWNEAIARDEVDVLTFSFSHREDSEPKALRHQYDESALMGAALGITLIAAGGDSGEPDVPCGSPYVTCVGGTELVASQTGERESEIAWIMSGSGASKSFGRPHWQDGHVPGETRGVADLALNSSTDYPMWTRRWASWEYFGGTSFAAPAFAGMVAVINNYRKVHGRPRVGWLNRTLYLHEPTRATFRDIIKGHTEFHTAGPGWDYPTGVGAPDVAALAAALP